MDEIQMGLARSPLAFWEYSFGGAKNVADNTQEVAREER